MRWMVGSCWMTVLTACGGLTPTTEVGDKVVDTDAAVAIDSEVVDSEAVWDTAGADTSLTGQDSDVGADPDPPIDTDQGASNPPGPGGTLSITDVEPGDGSDLGGTEVVLTGGPFDPVTDVTFGGVPGVVTSTTATEIVVSTPASVVPGPVDVTVTTSAGTSTLADGFVYWPDGTGKVGASGYFEWFDRLGTYWGGAPDFGATGMYFHEPLAFEQWQAWTDVFDSCRMDYVSNVTVYVYDPAASALSLTPMSGSVATLTPDVTNPWLYTGDLTTSQWVPNTGYRLQPAINANPTWPEFQLDYFLETPGNFSVTSPAMDTSFPPNVSPSFTLSWPVSNPGDYVLISISHAWNYDPTSMTFGNEEILTCAVADDGSFTIPNNWSVWNTGDDQLVILTGRARTSSAILPYNNAKVDVSGVSWVVGAALPQ